MHGQPLDHVVVEWVDVVLPRLFLEGLLQLRELLGVLVGQVRAFREVLGHVVELPLVVLERQGDVDVPGHPFGVQRDGLPPFDPDGTVAEHLVVLPLLAIRRIGIVERVEHGRSVHRLLLDAVVAVRHGQLGRFQNRRGDIADVVILAADLAFAPDALRPVDYQRVRLAAAMLALFEIAERRVAGHGPAGVVVRVGRLVSPAGVVPHAGIERRLHPVQHVGLVERARKTTFAAGAVVRGHEDQRVVQLTDPLQILDHASDLIVHVLHLGREDLHLTRVKQLLVVTERIPGLDLTDPLRQLRALRDDAEADLVLQDHLARLVPAHVELASILRSILRRRVVRRMH